MSTKGKLSKKDYIPLFSILSALFVLSMFYRVANAVIAPNLIEEFHINAEELGILGAVVFYAFALVQIPLGPLLDRIGPRIIMTSFSLAGAAGVMIFAFSRSFGLALIGRALMGVGTAAALMGSLKVFTLRLPPEKFASFAGLIISFGMLGSILAASPFACLTSLIGWRMTLIISAIVTVILSLLTFWVLGDKKKEEGSDDVPAAPGQKISVLEAARLVFGSISFWQIAAPAFCRYGTFVSLQGLWLGLYLMDIEGYSPIRTGNILIMLSVGMIAGSPCAGWLYDRVSHSKKGIILLGLVLYCLSLFPLLGIFKVKYAFVYAVIYFVIGFFSGFGMLLYSHAKEIFPANLSGTVMTWVNFFLIAGGAFFTQAMGKIIEFFPHSGRSYPPEAYHLSFLLCFICMGASAIFYSFCKKR